MNAIAHQVAEELASEFGAKVIDFKPAVEQDELERLAAFHRKAEARYCQRAADTRRSMKIKEAALKAEEKTELARHKAAMDLISEKRSSNKELGERAIAADERLAAYNRNAVNDLTGE